MTSTRAPDLQSQVAQVSLNYRYVSAWNEINTRIAQRQSALAVFVALETALVSILFTSHGVPAIVNPNIFSLLIPAVSFAFAFLHYEHDKAIALLQCFLTDCEHFTAKQSHELGALPAYNLCLYYRDKAEETRRLHDFSSVVLVLLFNVVGYVVAQHAYPNVFSFADWPVFLYFTAAVGSCIVVAKHSIRRHNFINDPLRTPHPIPMMPVDRSG